MFVVRNNLNCSYTVILSSFCLLTLIYSFYCTEKDGLWAALAWMSIIMKANEETSVGQPLVSVKDIVTKHWAKYGRHFYCRYDYENVDSDSANKVMDLIRDTFVSNTATAATGSTISSKDGTIQLINAEEFEYTDPVDGTKTTKQGLTLFFIYPLSGDTARVVFRLSGTGSAGATIRMYLERYEKDILKHTQSAPVALQDLANYAIQLVKIKEYTGRDSPTVIT
jgi:phosphoglucomutase